jgi:phosphohistidine phosphatase
MLRKRKLIPGAIYSSPWKRALQTAQVMARELGGKGLKPKPVPSLSDDPDLDAIRQDLSGLEGLETVAIVGHEPWLSGLASLLLTGEPHRVSIDFPKSGIIGIEADAIEAGSGMLKFFLRPKLL